jgi:hypothetical protein
MFLLALLAAAAAAPAMESEIPADSPFARSEAIAGIDLTGRYRNYTHADTWYPSWASDGNLYSPWTDGYIRYPDAQQVPLPPFDPSHPGHASNSLDFGGRKASTAQARIAGRDPLHLSIQDLPPRIDGDPKPYGGRYPAGSLVYNGVWYYGTYTLRNSSHRDCGGVGWTEFGPFVGFRTSTDAGVTWQETPHSPMQPLFGENPDVAPVRIGAPHFVDFGRNMQYSPDGRAYLLAHGSTDPTSCDNWIQGDQVYLLRVKPSPRTVNDRGAYEYFAGTDAAGQPRWSHSLADLAPVLDWPGHLGSSSATWVPGLRRYLMFVTRGKSATQGDSMVFEARALTGPWRIVAYWKDFGPFAYFLNLPSKFVSADGRSAWLLYSANWSSKPVDGTPAGSVYSFSIHEIRLRLNDRRRAVTAAQPAASRPSTLR